MVPAKIDCIFNSRQGKADKFENDANQLPLFVKPAVELIKALAGTQLDALSPPQAFEFLREWKNKSCEVNCLPPV